MEGPVTLFPTRPDARLAIVASILMAALVVIAILSGEPSPVTGTGENPSIGGPDPQQRAELAMDSALKNAATAEESHLTHSKGYTTDVSLLMEEEGLRVSEGVMISIPIATRQRYCIEATHLEFPDLTMSYDSDRGTPEARACS
jgi:hypothetical protein